MTKICELTGKTVMSGHKVSHAVNRTKRKFLPNLQMVSLTSDALGRVLRLRISVAALRSVEHCGGIDAFLRNAQPISLSTRAQGYRRQLLGAQKAQAFEPSKKRKAASAKSQKARQRKTATQAAAKAPDKASTEVGTGT